MITCYAIKYSEKELKLSSQSFTAAQREAIWLAHSCKCAYTRETLDVSNFHIDHIIPESLKENPVLMAETLSKLGLQQDFDLLGWENLLPCRPGVNLQKSVTVFELPHIHFFLGIAAAKKQIVIDNLLKIERRKVRGRAIILLQQSLERGEITTEELAQLIEKYTENPEVIFELLQGLRFADAEEVLAVSNADIEELLNRPIRFGDNTDLDGLSLSNDENEERLVATCREYEEALSQGFYANTTFAIKMATYFEHQGGLLRALEKANTPKESYIAKPKVSIIDLSLMPLSLFPVMGETQDIIDDKISYQDKVDDDSLVIKRVSQNLLRIESAAMGQQLIEVARADFNGDGIEDILLFEYCYATGGTLGFGGIKIITRLSSDGMFELVSLPKP